MYKCTRCDKEFNNYDSLNRHSSRVHKTDKVKLYLETFHNNVYPKCKCGCGTDITYYRLGKRFENNRFGNYIKGHVSRVNGGFYSPKGAKKSGKSRKKRFKDGTITQWNKGKNLRDFWGDEFNNNFKLNTSESIAKRTETLTGREISKEHYDKLCKQLAKNRKEMLQNQNITLPELLFSELLDELNIKYEFQFLYNGFHFDFLLKDYNILVEVDGDYWHANPKFYTKESYSNIQKKNLGFDKYKTIKIENDSKFNLLRFWEDDIKNNVKYVEQKLLDYIYIHEVS